MSNGSWIHEGSNIAIGKELKELVYQNGAVRSFVQTPTKHFISANKGMGKTLLLKFKRYQLQLDHMGPDRDGDADVRFVPGDSPFLDFVRDLPTVSRDTVEFLSRAANAERVWTLALQISALSHSTHRTQIHELGGLPEPFESWIRRRSSQAPSTVFRQLLQLTVSNLNRLSDRSGNLIDTAFRQIHSGIYFFIDRLDQACGELPRESWVGVQAGLLLAAWQNHQANAHVKTYASIRQEAYANFMDPVKANVDDSVEKLNYTSEELHDLMNVLTRLYEHRDRLEDFIGLEKVRNTWSEQEEDLFPYMHRHTVSRPRDLVRMAKRVSISQAQGDETRIRAAVNEQSSDLMSNEIFSEMSVFLDCLREPTSRGAFFKLLGRNVLSRDEVEQICLEFNGVVSKDTQGCAISQHPFCELYSIGLLGRIADGPDPDTRIQRFRRPDEPINLLQCDLPVSDFYFVHPGLQEAVRDSGARYEVARFLTVGDGYPWSDRQAAIANAQLAVRQLRDLAGRVPIQKEGAIRVQPSLKEAADRVLRVASREGVSSDEDRTQAIEELASAEWKALRRIPERLAAAGIDGDEYSEVVDAAVRVAFWIERAICGGD